MIIFYQQVKGVSSIAGYNNKKLIAKIALNIIHNWQFSQQQQELLKQYYNAHKVLVERLNSSEVSPEVRQQIEDTSLLPIVEIKKIK